MMQATIKGGKVFNKYNKVVTTDGVATSEVTVDGLHYMVSIGEDDMKYNRNFYVMMIEDTTVVIAEDEAEAKKLLTKSRRSDSVKITSTKKKVQTKGGAIDEEVKRCKEELGSDLVSLSMTKIKDKVTYLFTLGFSTKVIALAMEKRYQQIRQVTSKLEVK